VISDEELMVAYQQGQASAFDELYRRHSPKVYGYLTVRTPSRQQADDLLQSCFLKLHQSRHHFDVSQKFLPWLWSILRSVRIDALRREQRNPAKANHSEEESRKGWEALPTEPMNADDGEHALTENLLKGLPAAQRRLLELRTQRELSFDEIADELSITASTARQRFSRLVQSLKTRAAKSGEDLHE